MVAWSRLLKDVSHQLSRLLAERQIIPSVRSFVVYARCQWIDGATIKAGEYQLNANDTVADVVSRFQAGVVKQYRVTFPEGWTVSQWRIISGPSGFDYC